MGTSWTWSDGITRGIGSGLSITADDNVTILSPSIMVVNVAGSGLGRLQTYNPAFSTSGQNVIDVRMHPFAQEGKGYLPQVILGPVANIDTHEMIIGAKSEMEIHRKVEVRVLTRNYDLKGEQGFTLDGDNTRTKILDSIRQIIENNKSYPDGSTSFTYISTVDSGKDTDTVESPESIELYRTTMQVEVCYFEGSS